MAQLSEQDINQLDMSAWLKRSEGLKGSVVVEGALFKHTDGGRVYFMSEASGSGVRFELNRSDILDVSETPRVISILGEKFKAVRIMLNLDAMVVRHSVHLAAALIEYDDHRSITNIAGDKMAIKNTVVANVVMR